MFKAGQTIYRILEPDDGGDYVPQRLQVVVSMPDLLKVKHVGGREEIILFNAINELYDSELACYKECWKRNGTGDAFEQLCLRKGIRTQERKDAELARQMEVWGALDYDDLLSCLI